MLFRFGSLAAVILPLVVPPLTDAHAADLDSGYVKAKPVPDMPFFTVNDNRITFSYLFSGTTPGSYGTRANGTFDGKEAKQGVAFTHFDTWAYGTNLFNVSLSKSGKNDPAAPCTEPGVLLSGARGDCAGAVQIYGSLRSTFGFNEIFNTRALTWGPLRNVSLEVGADANTQNTFFAPQKRAVLAGLQFAFDLPYKGYVNVAPMYYKEWNHNGFAQCGVYGPGTPGVTCLADGNVDYRGTWAVETNYYMDLGFLPESIRYFSISGRAAWYGKKGGDNSPLPAKGFGPTSNDTLVEFNSEPIRLTFDASSAAWGKKYAHYVDLWVAYRYWQNKFGHNHDAAPGVCTIAGVNNNSCTESSLYTGVSLKF